MKLGVHIGYWGLGLTSEDQLKIVREVLDLVRSHVKPGATTYDLEKAAEPIQVILAETIEHIKEHYRH